MRAVIGLWCSVSWLVILSLVPIVARAEYFGNPTDGSRIFRGAFASGVAGPIVAMLAPDVLVFRHGEEIRGRDAYVAGPLGQELTHLRQFYSELLGQDVQEGSEAALVTSRIRYISRATESAESFVVAETLVFRRLGGSWQIVHIHRSQALGEPPS